MFGRGNFDISTVFLQFSKHAVWWSQL